MTVHLAKKMTNTLREHRQVRGLSQAGLAKQIGISRQALIAIETGASVPGTDIALRLSMVLGVRVESLFQLEGTTQEVRARLAEQSVKMDFTQESRVVLGEIDGRWIAHPIHAGDRGTLEHAADGIAQQVHPRSRTVDVEPLGDLDAARRQLLVMGCAPALGLLAARLGEAHIRLAWMPGSSEAALGALRRAEVHIAGIHLLDEPSGEYNVPVVRRRFSDRKMLLVNLASWEQGIVVAKGNPLKIRSATDLMRPRVRFIAREPGAGAHKLLERALRSQHGCAATLAKSSRVARGHLEVAEAISLGSADAGIAIRGAALAYGLDFTPLAHERFDLVFARELATDPRIERLVDVLESRAFRRELDSVGGYQTSASGHQVGETR